MEARRKRSSFALALLQDLAQEVQHQAEPAQSEWEEVVLGAQLPKEVCNLPSHLLPYI
jgi:hypothetical protein